MSSATKTGSSMSQDSVVEYGPSVRPRDGNGLPIAHRLSCVFGLYCCLPDDTTVDVENEVDSIACFMYPINHVESKLGRP